MSKNIGKFTTTLKNKDESFTIDYYKEFRTKWIPVQRILDVMNIDKKSLIKYTGRHAIKKIEYEGYKIECVDSIALLKLNELTLDEYLYNSLLKFSVWKNNIWFDIYDILKFVKIIKKYKDNKTTFFSDVNFYDKAQSDLYHDIENEISDEVSSLRLCLQKRRIDKIKYGVSSLLCTYFGEIKLDSFKSELEYSVKVNKTKRYNERLTHDEQVRWENMLSDNNLI